MPHDYRCDWLKNHFRDLTTMVLTKDAAEAVALKALGWLAGHDELLPVFLGATGASEADLRAGLQDPDFLASVLDFLLMDDAFILQFSAAAEIPPERVLHARQALPGGAQPHWT
jgi:hypothetical protein